jgi:hypothetical protein
MNTQTTTNEINALELLCKFVSQRPGLDFNDYGDVRIYRNEMREITRDMHDFYDLLNLARWKVENLSDKIAEYLKNTDGRLSLEGEKLQYITGQYYPTEYRPAASRVLVNIIWREFMKDEKLKTGHDIRKEVRKYISRRTAKNYFN